jgi:hypothetical protein
MTNFYLSWKTSWNDGFLRTNADPVTGSASKKGFIKTAMLSLLFLFVLGLSQGYAQTTLISPTGDGGFENGTTLAANNWVAVNSSTDGWIAGATPVVSAGQNCAFVSSTTTGAQTWTYSQTSTVQHLYYNVTLPQGESSVSLSFKWKAKGEGSGSDWDNLKVFWGTAAQIGTPTANTAVSSTYRVGNAWYNLSNTSYNTSTISLSGTPGTTYRLVFSWKSDSSDIVSPPAAIDEVSLISRPPVTSNPPITFLATELNAVGMKINWVDNSTDETAFKIYRSTDNVTFTQVGTNIATTSGAGTGQVYSSVQTGLLPSTTYYYRISSIADLESSFLTGSQATNAPGNFISIVTGNFGSATTWDVNSVPSLYDNVTISSGTQVTIDAAGQASNNVTINGNGALVYGSTPTSFTVNGNLTVDANGLFNVFQSTTGKTLNVKGNIVNNGRIDASPTSASLVLNGSTVQTVSGSGVFGGLVTSVTSTNTNGMIQNITFNNTSTAIPNIIWQAGNIRIANNITFTASRVNMNESTMYWGNFNTVGSLTAADGTGIINGKFSRWWTTAQTGTSLTSGSNPTTTTSKFPFVSPLGINRSAFINRSSSSTAGNTAGYTTMQYVDAPANTMTSGLSIVDGTYTINQRFDGSWNVAAESGYVYASGSHALAIVANNAYTSVGTTATTRIVSASTVAPGTHQNGTTTPGGQRISLSTAQLTSGSFYIGANAADILQPCTDTPVAGTLSAANQYICIGSTAAPAALTLTGFTANPGITFQWEESVDGGSTWNNATGGTGATTSSFTPPVITSDIRYRAKVTCTGSGIAVYSTVQEIAMVTCTYNTSFTAGGVAYQSIMPAKGGSGLAYSGAWINTSGDDNTSPVTLLTGTTFKYQGRPITGFRASTNGWMTFNTASTSTSYTNDLTSTGQNLVLAPFWDDLVLTGQSYANRDSSMRYLVEGTLGSGSAIITIEWSGIERFLIPGPDLNFQVKLHEQGNKIEYIYGNFKGFDGTFNDVYSYSIGMNGSVPSGTTSANRFALQTANYNHFDSATAPTTLVNMPNCNSKYTFTPGTYSGLTAAPTLVAPANDEPSGAFGLDVATAPTSELCGLYYNSRLATDSGKGQACATTAGNQDDDVWFAFETTAASEYSIVVRSSPLYDAVVELFDENLNSISCKNATGSGLTETLTATGLTPDGGFYYVRVFHNGTGSSSSGGSGEFSIAMNEVLYPPANDNIAGAIALNVNASCQTTSSILPNTLVATASPTTPAGCNNADDDVWYSFVATSTLNEVKVQSASGYNAVMQILSSSDNTATGTLTELVCRNSTSTGGEETYAGPFIVGQTYFVRVYHAATGVGTGNFTICVSAPTPSCAVNATPANAATNVSLTPTLTWTATNATSYDVYLGNASGALSLVAENITTTSYTLTTDQVLVGLSNYYWYVVPENVNGAATCTVANETSFTTQSDCLAPTALTFLPTSATSATLSWTSPVIGQTPQGYEYAVTDTNVAPTTSGTATTLNSVSVADLTSGSTYYFHVRSMCANGEMGSWVTSSALVMPVIIPVPWTEGFATTTLPAQWSNSGYSIGSFPSGNPGNAIYDNLWSSSTTANFATPNLGTIATNHILTFDYKLQDYDDSTIAPTAGSGNFVVQVSTNYGATYTTLETVDNDGVTGWRQKSYDLAPYAGENIKLKIIGNWISGDYYLSFDNISVSALCSGMPTAGTVSVASQSLCPAAPVASITITGASSDAGIAYQWQQSTDNGVEWVDAIGGTGVNSLTYSPPVFAGDVILYRLRVSCTTTGEEAYSNTSQVNGNPRAVPFTETFDEIANLTGWSTAGFVVGSTRGATGNSGANAYINIWSSTPSGYLTTANYGPITAGQALRFDYQLSNYSFPYAAPEAGSGNVVVAVSTDCGATFTTLETINNDGEAGYRAKTYSLASYEGQNVVFKITGNRTSGDYDLSIDNLAVIVPAPEVASYSPATVCAGSAVTISGNYFSTVTSVKVGTTDVTFNIVNANTITFTAPSTSTGGTITVTNPGGQGTSVLNLVIDNTTAAITADGPTTFCSGGSVVLTASPATSYSWSTGATTQSITVNQSGNYSVSIINENRCALRSESVAVTVNPVSFETVEQSACGSYTWSLTGQTYTESGDYTYMTTNASGCPHTTTLQLTISNGAITAQPTAPTICKSIGATASISVEVSGANLPTYQWQVQTASSTTVWTPIVNNANYSGATSATLNITRTTTSLPATGTKYRVLVTSCGTTVTSNAVALAELATLSKAATIAVVTRLTPTATTCEGTTVDLSLAAGSIGNVQWEMSTTSATEGFSNVGSLIQQSALSAVNTIMSFTTPTLTQDTWFRVVATNGVCSSATSAAIKINVSTTPTAGTIAAGDITVCAPLVAPSSTVFDVTGSALANSITNSTTLSLEGTTSGTTIVWERSTNFVNATDAAPVWSTVTNLTATTETGASYSGVGTVDLVVGNLAADTWFRARVINGACSVTTDVVKITVSKSAKAGTVTSPTTVCTGGSITFTSAAYTGSAIAWQVSTTSSTTGFETVAGANGLTFTMDNVTLVAPGQKFYVRSVVTSGACTQARSAVKTITVNPLSVAGTVTGAGIVCSGGGATLKLAGNVGTIQWEYSADGVDYVNVPTATVGSASTFSTTSATGTSATYVLTNVTAGTYFRAKVTSGACSASYTTPVQMVIGTEAVAGTATAASSTICAASGTTITLTGSVGSITWQKSSNWTAATPTWTAVTNATASTLATGNLTASTAFKAVVTIGSCSIVETTPVIITVNLAAKGGTVAIATTNPGATICAGSSKTLTVSGNVGTIQWQMSTTSATEGFENVSGATSSPYTFTNITQNAWFRVVATSGVCTTTANSTAVGITVTTIPAVAGTISGTNSVCTATGSTLTLGGSTGSIVWQKAVAPFTTWAAISGQTSATLATGNLSATTAYRAILTSGSCTATTSAYVVTVSPLAKAATVTGNSLIKTLPNAICTTTTAPLTLGTGTVGTIQWQFYNAGSSATAVSATTANSFTWTDIDGATSSVLAASSATIGNVWFRVKMTSGPCSVVYSTPVNVWFKLCNTREQAPVTIFNVKGYPNPYSTNFTVSLETPSDSMVYVSVYDMTGKQIENREVTPSELQDLQLGSNWSTGVYNVIVAQDNQVKTMRMIKK